MSKSVKKRPRMEDESSDEEDALEMDRNFALLSKRSAMQTSAQKDMVYSEDEDEKNGSAEEGEEDDAVDDGGDDKGVSESEEDDAGDDKEVSESEEDDAGDDKEVSESEEDDAGDDKEVSESEDDDAGDDDDEVSESDKDSVPGEAFNKESKMGSHTDMNLKKDLSTMSFEDIMKLQNKVGTKAYNKFAYGATQTKQQNTEPIKRLSKYKPEEISSKKHVPFLRKVVHVKKNISRDPRFDDLSGEYKPELFNKTYKFINDLREQEMQMLRKQLKKTKSEEKKAELKALLKRLENQQRARQRQEQDREKELKFKRMQRELVGQGHKPYYLKKSDKKKMELAEKYSDLKKSGKLENFLSKKRKRNATKDRRKLPNQHKAQ